MAFYEEEVTGNSAYLDQKLNDLELEDSRSFLKLGLTTANSTDYGEFDIWLGVSFDLASKNLAEAIDSLKLTSIVPNKLIQSKYENKAIKDGLMYKYTKKWNKGDTYNGNKKAKGFGYEVALLSLPEEFLVAAVKFHTDETTSAVAIDTTGTDTDDTQGIAGTAKVV